MAKRPKHPSKDINDAIKYAENQGWRYETSGKSAHAWGKLLCSFANPDGCRMSIWSTPKNPVIHARQIRRFVEKCPHKGGNHYDS